MNIIKKIADKQIDDSVHQQLIRFGKGNYEGRFPLNLHKTKKVKIKSGFEFANDLVLLCAEFGACVVSGIVLSKENISDMMSAKNIQGHSETKKGGLFYLNNIDSQELKPEQLRELGKVSYFLLLDAKGEDFELKIPKKKLPKPGKNADKIDTKFCRLTVDEKHYQRIKDDFFWDFPDTKKIQIKHTVVVNEILMPEGEKDFAKIREQSKRKGKLIRKAVFDDKEQIKEYDFEA